MYLDKVETTNLKRGSKKIIDLPMQQIQGKNSVDVQGRN
jgi:hypothetical protein